MGLRNVKDPYVMSNHLSLGQSFVYLLIPSLDLRVEVNFQ